MESVIDIIQISLSAVIGLWLADFATGCFHWVVDNYFDPKWPIVGPHYIEPAHLHHDEAMYEFELSTWITHLYIWMAVICVGLFFWAVGLMSLVIISACFFGFLTNIIHGWSHKRPEDNVPIVRFLQRLGLFQSTQHHTIHHGGNSDSHYCLLTDHINPILEMIGLWRFLDKLLSRIGIQKFWWETSEVPSISP